MSKKRIIIAYYSLIVLAVLLVGNLLCGLYGHRNLIIYFFDVGQGDAILIYTPKGQTILIDGGVDNSVVYKLGKYLPYYNRQIDLLVLTHPDSDHLTGIIEVLKRYNVKNVLVNGQNHNSALFKAWQNDIKFSQANYLIAGDINFIPLGLDISLKILYPEKSLVDSKLDETNDGSIVIKLVDNSVSFLFTGDAPIKTIEAELLTNHVDINSDVLKVGHHGSKYSSGSNFLSAVMPKLAIISAGKDNKFGHPNKETLERLNVVNAKILSTIELGDILISSDGRKIWY